MTFSELRTALSARGFDYSTSTELNTYLNQAYAEICNYAPWPFLETSTTKTNGQTITDVSSILSVYEPLGQLELRGVTRDWLKQNLSSDLTTTGTATYWYLTDTTFNVYPVDTDTFTIYYLKVPAVLSGDTDEPLIPTRFQDLIIDRAAIKGYKANDNWQIVQAARQEYAADLEAMASHYFAKNLQVPGEIYSMAEHE